MGEALSNLSAIFVLGLSTFMSDNEIWGHYISSARNCLTFLLAVLNKISWTTSWLAISPYLSTA